MFQLALLSLRLDKCELQLAFWTQLSPFLAPACQYCSYCKTLDTITVVECVAIMEKYTRHFIIKFLSLLTRPEIVDKSSPDILLANNK